MPYSESVGVTKRDRNRLILQVVAAFAFTYLANTIYTALRLPYAGIANVVFLAVGAAAVYTAFRHGIIEYIYEIHADKLTFLTRLGGVDRVLAEVPLARVQRIAEAHSEAAKSVQEAFRYNAVKTKRAGTQYVCLFTDAAGKLCKLRFEPSETYLQMAAKAGVSILT